MTNIFNRVKEAIENAIDNGYDPLAMKAKALAEDLFDKASDLSDETIENITDAVKQVKERFGNKDE